MSLVARLSLVAAVLSGAVLVMLPTMSFAADTHPVAVVDDAYDDGNRDGNDAPATTVITAGDTVVWEWQGDNEHTVTSQPTSPMAFDSDSECADQEDDTACRTKGNTFEVRFDEPGTYDYLCEVHGLLMRGTIEVQPAPEPSGSDSGSSEPSSEESSEEEPSSEPPSSEPEPSESPSPQEEPNPEPTSESASEPQDDPADAAGRPPRADGPAVGVQDEPTDRSTRGLRPRVAPDAAEGSTFSPFPSAPDLPSESEDMAVNIPSRGGGPPRGAVVGVAIASVIGSAGAFGKIVLFGQPWG